MIILNQQFDNLDGVIKDEIIKLEMFYFGKTLLDLYESDLLLKFNLLFKNDNFIGYVCYKKHLAIDIYMICVNVKNMGYGLELLQCFENSDIILEVDCQNVNALNFYLNNGFTIERKLKNYYKNSDGLFLRRCSDN